MARHGSVHSVSPTMTARVPPAWHWVRAPGPMIQKPCLAKAVAPGASLTCATTSRRYRPARRGRNPVGPSPSHSVTYRAWSVRNGGARSCRYLKSGRTIVVPSVWRKIAHASTSRCGLAQSVEAETRSISMSCHGWECIGIMGLRSSRTCLGRVCRRHGWVHALATRLGTRLLVGSHLHTGLGGSAS